MSNGNLKEAKSCSEVPNIPTLLTPSNSGLWKPYVCHWMKFMIVGCKLLSKVGWDIILVRQTCIYSSSSKMEKTQSGLVNPLF